MQETQEGHFMDEDSSPIASMRAITISRQSGTGGHLVAEEVARHLRLCGPRGAASWMIFDRNLLERVLEDHQLPARLD